MTLTIRVALAAVLVSASLLCNASNAQQQNPVTSLFSPSSDRIYQARQRAAKASRIATQIETNATVETVDYSILDDQAKVEIVEPGVEYIDEAPQMMNEGSMMMDPSMSDGHMHGSGGCESCGTGDCGSGNCGTGNCGTGNCGTGDCGHCNSCMMMCLPLCFKLNWDDFSLNAGVNGFKNGLNRGIDGSFGFQYGFNWGMPLSLLKSSGIGLQVGASGSNANLYEGSFVNATRDQTFFTVGLFRRVDWGWQGGLVFDHLKDQWYYDVEVSQIRGQLSWVFPKCNELGFQFSASDSEGNGATTTAVPGATTMTTNETIGATNLYTFFWRHRLDNCGKSMRILGGWTGDSQGIVGADFHVPLTNCLALDTGFTFLLPDQQGSRTQNEEEAWNVGVNLVWYPRCGSASGSTSYYRPLFNVANNGDFILRRQ